MQIKIKSTGEIFTTTGDTMHCWKVGNRRIWKDDCSIMIKPVLDTGKDYNMNRINHPATKLKFDTDHPDWGKAMDIAPMANELLRHWLLTYWHDKDRRKNAWQHSDQDMIKIARYFGSETLAKEMEEDCK